MLVTDILSNNCDGLQLISMLCSDFLKETSAPLYKYLPVHYNSLQKVKARKQKKLDTISEAFNKAFNTTLSDLRQRAIIAYPSSPPIVENCEPYYVLPINGYRFMYSKEVTNSTCNYKQMIDILFEQFGDNYQALNIIIDLLKFTYTNQNICEGIQSNSEIILYGIPYYYAIKVSDFPNYQDLITITNKYIKRT